MLSNIKMVADNYKFPNHFTLFPHFSNRWRILNTRAAETSLPH